MPTTPAQRAATERNMKRVREYRISLKSGKPCTDCDVVYPHYVMQWDHIKGDKLNSVSQLQSIRLIDIEVAKCELVCANCHAIRTWGRAHPNEQIALF